MMGHERLWEGRNACEFVANDGHILYHEVVRAQEIQKLRTTCQRRGHYGARIAYIGLHKVWIEAQEDDMLTSLAW